MQVSAKHPDKNYISGISYSEGNAYGEVLYTDTPLSFWGGVDSNTGKVIDTHHPLFGQSISGKIFVLPCGRGSCTGSSIILELLLNGKAPAALVLSQQDSIVMAGVLVAKLFFGYSLPLIVIDKEKSNLLSSLKVVGLSHGRLIIADHDVCDDMQPNEVADSDFSTLDLTSYDKELLSGKRGEASRLAMLLICSMAIFQGAMSLINVRQAHIDACIYTGKGSLAFSQKIKALEAHVVIPTTLNAISIDARNWKNQTVAEKVAVPAKLLADNYLAIGARPSFTCAPYLLPSSPEKDDEIGWAESNAVVFANSIIGAHTQKNQDFMDVCIALTGRAPQAGCHVKINRRPKTRIVVTPSQDIDDAFYPLLGYKIGEITGSEIPLITGLSRLRPTRDNLKALAAAFATTSSAPMFHIEKITAEISDNTEWLGLDLPELKISPADILNTWRLLNEKGSTKIDLVALGNPHFSIEEALLLAGLCRKKVKNPDVDFYITMGRDCFAELKTQQAFNDLEEFGVVFITDTCWCMIGRPTIKDHHKVILTNSGKYAHYGAGLTKRRMRFGSLSDCVNAAVEGYLQMTPPHWLANHGNESENNVQL